jgi:hypothetical protein
MVVLAVRTLSARSSALLSGYEAALDEALYRAAPAGTDQVALAWAC